MNLFFKIVFLSLGSIFFSPFSAYTQNAKENSDFIARDIYFSLVGKISTEESNKTMGVATKAKQTLYYESLVSNIINSHEFYKYIESKLRVELLEGCSEQYLKEQVLDYYFLFYSAKSANIKAQYEKKYNALNFLGLIIMNIPPKDLSIKSIQTNMINSPIYEAINMGSFNFISATFQHFLNRKPTKFELEQGINMIEGKYSILFGKMGSSRADFIEIFFNSSLYYEEQIKYWYLYFYNKEISNERLLQILKSHCCSSEIESLIKIIIKDKWDDTLQ